MSQFSAIGNANSSAQTSTKPSLLVTSSASATATSNISQQQAQNEANTTAQNVANSVAQNNANIISQTINSITAAIKGQYSYLGIYYAVPTDVGTNSTFTGIIFPNTNEKQNSIILNYVKPIYYDNSLNPNFVPTQQIPNSILKGFYSLTYENNNNNNTSTLTGQRTTYKYIPYNNGYIYNMVVSVNVILQCNILITPNLSVDDLNGSITSLQVVNKMAQGISVYTPNGNFDKFDGVQLAETYSQNGNWNFLYTNFDNAFISGSSNNIYPYTITQAVGP